MNKSIKTAQSGFTLIELIVVIVILGILAATAMPKFANMGGDARAATVQAAKGALSATSAMVHGKYLLNPAASTNGKSLSIEGANVSFLNGYPAADADFIKAAGLDGFNVANAAGSVTLVPTSIFNTSAASTCFVRYTNAADPATAPVIEAVTTTCD